MITKLEPNEVFVYGANEAGRHGAGAAKQAMQWGAQYGRYGLMGNTYGIPTKDEDIETLPLDEIAKHVRDFTVTVRERRDLKFLVTKIGCGLAGYTEQEIAPLFEHLQFEENVVLPEEFITAVGYLSIKGVKYPIKDKIVANLLYNIVNRSNIGQKKYGTTLAQNNTDDFLKHLQEELLDGSLYIQKLRYDSSI
jgi:hypothetical protein